MYGNQDGSIPASYRVLYFIGWKPDPSQVSFIYLSNKKKNFFFYSSCTEKPSQTWFSECVIQGY